MNKLIFPILAFALAACTETSTLAVVETDLDKDGVLDNVDQCPDTSTGQSVDASGCSRKQKVVAALNSKWSMDEFSFGINISPDDMGFRMTEESISFSGELSTVIEEITFSISKDGYISDVKLSTSSEYRADGDPSLSINDDIDRMELILSVKGARTDGLGDFIFVWVR